jgi:hypothetical protein
MSDPRIICAAIQRADGCIVAGPRHFDQTMWCQILDITSEAFRLIQSNGSGETGVPPAVVNWRGAEEGFIDQHGKFYTRQEAWPIALAGKQILQHELDSNWSIGSLHSEHLY